MAESAATHFRATLPVRWSDCDPAGIVYYANYYTLVEAAMIELLRARGTSWRLLGAPYDAHFPRVESHCVYRASATYEDLVEVELWVPGLTAKVVTLAFRATRQRDDRLLCEGHVKFAMVAPGADGQESACELPSEVRAIFASLAGEEISARGG